MLNTSELRRKGRPQKIYDRKDIRLEVRLDDLHWSMIENLCMVKGINISELVRYLVHKEYENEFFED